MNCFCILTTRYGRDIPDPTSDDLQMALNEVFSLEDDEHPNSWLRYGSDSGQMFILDVYQSGRIIFTQWADTDYEAELAAPEQLEHISHQSVLTLWQALQRGDMDCIRAEAWLRVV